MFDNPKKELQRLEEQLLAAEEEPWAEPMEAPEEAPAEEPEAGGRFLRREEPEEQPPREPEDEEETPGRQSNRAPILVAALLLEVAALFGVLAWWLLWR
ncbi:MAG: hypothetical protein ACI3XG_08275 [Faecousia sp.]